MATPLRLCGPGEPPAVVYIYARSIRTVSLSLTPAAVLVVVAVVTVAGAVNGVAGFGFAVVGTMVLASVLDPATAVVFMIVPILAVNVSLVSELSVGEFRQCGRRFAPFITAAAVGTVVGMAVLDLLPEAPLRILLGIVSLLFVASSQRLVALPSPGAAGVGRVAGTGAGMALVGGVSGVLFGATNVGVQLVAYVRSYDLGHGLFVGVVALVFVGINGLRVGAAAALGLYPDPRLVVGSALAIVPALAGVAVGKRLRRAVTERVRRGSVLALLTVIGVRLLAGGIGAL